MSNQSLEEVFQEYESLFASSEKLVRVVLSGRRRNMQTEHERIDLRPVLLKEVLHIQVAYSDGRAMTTKNFLPDKTPFSQYLRSGYAMFSLSTLQEASAYESQKRVNRLCIALKRQKNNTLIMIEAKHACSIPLIHF